MGMNPLQIIYGVVGLIIVSAVGGYIWNCESQKEKFAVYKSNVELLGKKAQADADKQKADDKLRKEKADAENKRTADNLRLTIKRLRDANASRGIVPAAPAGSSRPDLAAFDRAEYLGATGKLVEGLRGLADEGTAATVDLDTAKTWAQGQQAVR